MSRTTSFANVAAVDPGAAVLPVSSWEICHPSPSLQHGLSHDLSQRSPGASRAVIVDSQGETLLVAVSEPADRGLAARLASIARRPVQLQAAGPDEIDLALALCEGRPDAPERKRRRLVTLADDLGLSYLLAPGANQDDPLTHLSGEWGPE